jgi:hypothetical protein
MKPNDTALGQRRKLGIAGSAQPTALQRVFSLPQRLAKKQVVHGDFEKLSPQCLMEQDFSLFATALYSWTLRERCQI